MPVGGALSGLIMNGPCLLGPFWGTMEMAWVEHWAWDLDHWNSS